MRLPMIVLAAVALVTGQIAHAQVSYSTVAVSGDAAPGTSTQFEDFYHPAISASGNVVFGATLVPMTPGVWNGGIWLQSDQALQLIARSGTVAPGTMGALFHSFNSMTLNDAGVVAFNAYLEHGITGVDFSNHTGLWTWAGGDLRLIARQGQSVLTKSANVTFGEFLYHQPRVNAENDLVFQNGGTVWMLRGPELLALANHLDPAPGTKGLAFVGEFRSAVVNDHGHVAFLARLAGQGAGISHGAWRSHEGLVEKIAAVGDVIEGTAGTSLTDATQWVGINNAGQVAIVAELTVVDPTQDYNGAVCVASGDDIVARVRTGDVPDNQPTWTFLAARDIVLNGAGVVAGSGTFRRPESSQWFRSLWVSDHTHLWILIGRETIVPGGRGAIFAHHDKPSINLHGDIAFRASWRIDQGPLNHGLWMYDGMARRLLLIARDGDEFALPGRGDVRTIDRAFFLLDFDGAIGGSGGQDGKPSALSDSRQLAFVLRFTDGSSGVFTARLSSCPADLDGDDDADRYDLLEFVARWRSQEPKADWTGDGFVMPSDLVSYVHEWIDGCH